MDRKGQVGGGLGARILAVIFGIILVVGVAIPITQEVISTANLTGISLTIVEFIPTFLALAGLALAAALVVLR